MLQLMSDCALAEAASCEAVECVEWRGCGGMKGEVGQESMVIYADKGPVNTVRAVSKMIYQVL